VVVGLVLGVGLAVITSMALRPSGSDAAGVVTAPPQPGLVALNAVPWANLVGLEHAVTGEPVPLPEGRVLSTPFRLELPAGRYRARLENPAFSAPLDVELTVRQGSVTRLTDLRLPGFDPEAAIDELVALSLPGETVP